MEPLNETITRATWTQMVGLAGTVISQYVGPDSTIATLLEIARNAKSVTLHVDGARVAYIEVTEVTP